MNQAAAFLALQIQFVKGRKNVVCMNDEAPRIFPASVGDEHLSVVVKVGTIAPAPARTAQLLTDEFPILHRLAFLPQAPRRSSFAFARQDYAVDPPKRRTAQGRAPASPDGERCGESLCGEICGIVRHVHGLRWGDAEICRLFRNPVPVGRLCLGGVHEVEAGYDFFPSVAGDYVEGIAIVPSVGLPLATVDSLEGLGRRGRGRLCLARQREGEKQS